MEAVEVPCCQAPTVSGTQIVIAQRSVSQWHQRTQPFVPPEAHWEGCHVLSR